MESRYIHKRHNVSVLMYHLVCAAKYRRVVMSKHVDKVLREACLEIEKRWEIVFLEIGMDRDHAHFLIQSVPTYSVTKIVTTVMHQARLLETKSLNLAPVGLLPQTRRALSRKSGSLGVSGRVDFARRVSNQPTNWSTSKSGRRSVACSISTSLLIIIISQRDGKQVNMKASLDIPDDLYKKVKARSVEKHQISNE